MTAMMTALTQRQRDMLADPLPYMQEEELEVVEEFCESCRVALALIDAQDKIIERLTTDALKGK